MGQQSDEQYLEGDFVTGDEALGAIGNVVVGLVTIFIVVPIKIILFFIRRARTRSRGRHRG